MGLVQFIFTDPIGEVYMEDPWHWIKETGSKGGPEENQVPQSAVGNQIQEPKSIRNNKYILGSKS